MEVVFVRARDPGKFIDRVYGLPDVFATDNIGHPLRVAIGQAALSNLGRNFAANAAIPVGGSPPDVDLKWPPHAESTRRARLKGKGPASQQYQSIVRWLVTDLNYPLPVARQTAKRATKATGGGVTAVKLPGSVQVELLRDTGIMGNSISAGALTRDGVYMSPTGPGANEQVFDISPGEIIVGTTDFKAPFHHYGTKRMPKRPLWPEPQDWPQDWWDDVKDVIVQVLPHVIRTMGQ